MSLSKNAPSGAHGSPQPQPTSWKAVFPVDTAEVAQQLHKLKLVPAVALVSAFVNANSNAARGGYLYSLASLFTEAPPLATIMKFGPRFEDISAFFANLVLAEDARPPLSEVKWTAGEEGVVFQGLEEAIQQDPKVTIDLTQEQPISIGKILVENTGIVKFFLGALATICSLFGVTKVLTLDSGAELLSNIKHLSSLVLSGKNIISGMSEFLDCCLPTFYSLFGVEYVSDSYKAVKELSEKIEKLYQEVLQYSRMLKVDFFGTQLSTLGELESQYKRLTTEHTAVITTTRSTYNFSTRLNQIDTIIRELFDIITEVYKARGGKQRPVVVWFCGRAGIGKSFMASKFSQRLAEKDNSSVYSRTWADEYWSNYRFQTVVYMDDVGQMTNEHRDINEFMRYTGDDAKDVVCADIPSKGNSFVSKYIVCTSNNMWIAPPVPLADFEAPNRRRDAVVYVHFPQLAEFKSRNSGAEPPMEWYDQNKPKLFLINPTWGHTLEKSNAQHNLKFSIDEDWVIREITMEELFQRTLNLQNMRAETFRARLLAIKEYEGVIAIPPSPIPYDPQLNFAFPPKRGSSIKYTKEYESHGFDMDDFARVHEGNLEDLLKLHKISLSSDWAPRLATALEAPLLVERNMDYEIHGTTRIAEDVVALRKWRSEQMFYLRLTNRKGTKCELYSSRIEEAEHQGAPLYTKKQVNTCPSIIIKGPPGTGKTFLVEECIDPSLLYVVKYEPQEKIPRNRVVFLDDITISQDRLAIAKRIIQSHHTKPTQRLVIATLNEDTWVWKSAKNDEKDLMLRRSHVVTADYTQWLRARAMLARVTPSDFIKKMDDRDSYITWHFSLYPRRGQEIESLQPSQKATQSLILEELRNGVLPNEVLVHHEIPLPHHPNPELKIFIDKEKDITAKNIKVLVRRGTDYVVPTAMEYLAIIKFCMQFEPYLRGKITDRHQIPTAINRHEIKNDTTYVSCMIAIESYTMCIEDVSGKLFAYTTEDGNCDFAIDGDTIVWKDKVYVVENSLDSAIFNALKRAQQQPKVSVAKMQWSACKVPDVQTYWTQQTMTRFIAQMIGFAEIAMQFGLSFAMLADAAPKGLAMVQNLKPTEFEGAKGKMHYREKTYDDMPSRSSDLTYDNDRREERTVRKSRETYDTSSGKNLTSEELKAINKSIDQQVAAGAKRIIVPNKSFSRPGYNTRYDNERSEWYLEKINGPLHEGLVYEGKLTGCFPVQVHHVNLGTFYALQEEDTLYFAHKISSEEWVVFSVQADDKNIVKIKQLRWENCVHNCLEHDRRGIHLNSLIGTKYYCTDNFEIEFIGHCLGHSRVEEIKVKFEDKANHLSAPRQEGAFDAEAMETLFQVDANHRVNIFVDDKFFCAGIMIKQDIGISVAHIKSDKFTMQFTYQEDQTKYDCKVIRRAQQNDVLAFKVINPSFPRVKDITKKFVTDDSLSDHLGATRCQPAIAVMLSRTTRSGKQHAVTTQAEAKSYIICSAGTDSKGAISYANRIGYHGMTGVTRAGDCGSLGTLMAPSLNAKLCGIHSRGKNDISILAPVSQEYLNWITGEDQTVNQSVQEVQHPYLEYGMQYQDQHGFEVFAKPQRPVFIPTGTTDYQSGIKYLEHHEPTIKSKSDPRNILRRDFLEEGIGRYNMQLPKVDDLQEKANFAARSIGEYIATLMMSKRMHTRILTNTEAINGTSKTEFPSTKPLERSGAVGYPYNMIFNKACKGDFLYQNARNQHWYFKADKESQKILSDASRYFDDARHGIEHHHVWAAYLKDEPVGYKKIYNLSKQKTRIFFAGSMSYQLAYRRAFGAALWRITDLHLEIPVRVGIKARDIEWQLLANQHLEASDQGFDSDMENWDGTVPIEFLRAVPIVYNIIHKVTDPDWSPEDDVARNVLHHAVEGARVIVRNRVVKMKQSMASGFPGTAIENSLINWMLYFLCYMESVPPQLQTFAHFMDTTRLSVYGDDNLCTVRPSVQPFFHFNSFKIQAAKFGFKVTDAAKLGGEQPNLKPLEELQFLKRGFTRRGWRYFPTIEKDSISKMTEWIRNPKAYEYRGNWRRNDIPGIFESSFMDNLQEVVLHGKDFYEEYVAIVKPQIRAHGYRIIIPEYEELLNQTDFC